MRDNFRAFPFLLLLSAVSLDQVSVFHFAELLEATLVPGHGSILFFSCLCLLFGNQKDNGVLIRFFKDIPHFLQAVFVLPCHKSYGEISRQ